MLMRYLITGAGGQLGREWDKYLKKNTLEYRALSRKDADITDQEQIGSIIRDFDPDVIINCAAYTKVDDAEDQKDLAYSVNGTAAKILADICLENNILLVHYSTDYVFPGRSGDQEIYPRGYPEDAPTDPINEYGRTKRAGELAIQESGCDHLIFRVSWLCGPYGNNFVKTMLKLAEQRDELSVVNDQIGCPSFTGPVVRNSDAVIRSGGNGIYHLRSAGVATWFDLASKTFEKTGASVKLNAVGSEAFPTKARRPKYSLLRTKKIQQIKGVNIRAWEQDLQEMLDQIRT